MKHPFQNLAVNAAYNAMPDTDRSGALTLRHLILNTADEMDDVTNVDECLRWGQPSYISPIGSTLRIAVPKSGGFGIYAHCQSSIISDFAGKFGQDFRIDSNRGVLFRTGQDIQPDKLVFLIRHGLRYKV